MALSIQESQEYQGKDYWRWAVWLDGTPEELDTVESVLYILHPTFVKPVREIKNRATKFRLDSAGWGGFTIHANVAHRDGRETKLSHELVLYYPSGVPTLA